MAGKLLDETGLAELWALIRGADVKIQTGTYTGTGQFTASNPTTLTFDIVPKFVIVYYAPTNNDHRLAVFIRGVTPVFNYAGYGTTVNSAEMHVTWGEKSLSWYSQAGSGNTYKQMNDSGQVGHYIAVG